MYWCLPEVRNQLCTLCYQLPDRRQCTDAFQVHSIGYGMRCNMQKRCRGDEPGKCVFGSYVRNMRRCLLFMCCRMPETRLSHGTLQGMHANVPWMCRCLCENGNCNGSINGLPRKKAMALKFIFHRHYFFIDAFPVHFVDKITLAQAVLMPSMP